MCASTALVTLRAARAGGVSWAASWSTPSGSSTFTRILNARAGTSYQRICLVKAGGSQSISTGTIGAPAFSAMCAKPREKACSRFGAGLREPSGKMIIV